MRSALWIVVSLIALVGVIAIAGYFLPVEHDASRTADFTKPPEAVWALIQDPDSYSAWWDGADVQTAVVERVPPSRLVTRIVEETQFGGTWTFEIVKTDAGSRLTITERGEIYNVLFRALAKYVFGYTSTMDDFLTALKLKLST
ncbi:MAG TPA: hypothetical protein VFZ31_13775 [Vicinamibacterales bacterium]